LSSHFADSLLSASVFLSVLPQTSWKFRLNFLLAAAYQVFTYVFFSNSICNKVSIR
jgi:hypothetical protein